MRFIIPKAYSCTKQKVVNDKHESEAGQVIAHVQTYYGMEEIVPAHSGRIIAVCAGQGSSVVKGEIIAFVN